MRAGVQYVHRVSRIRHVAREQWFDALIALLAISAVLELVIGRDSPNSARTLWFALPAIGILVLPILLRRRFPFAAPAAYWLLAVGISVVDWRPIPFAVSLFPIGLTVWIDPLPSVRLPIRTPRRLSRRAAATISDAAAE